MAFIIFAVTLLAAQAVHGGNDPCMLKKQVRFFDRNQDGIIHISETIEGFKALGIGAAEAAASAAAIHTALSTFTRPGQPYDATFPIMVSNIALAKHTSDLEVYNQDGRFVSQKFEAIFANHARTKSSALNSSEVDELLKANRNGSFYTN